MRRRVLTASSMALVALLAGCSASDGSASDSPMGEGGSAVTMAEGPRADGDAEAAADASLALGAVASDAAAGTREVITRGEVALAVEDPRAATAAVVALVEREGGRVDARSESAGADGQDAVAWLTVRIPSDDMTSTLTALEDIGDVRRVDLTAEDVTGDVQDLDARIRAMQLSVARMEDLLSRASTNSDIISAESALAERQATLESMQTQRARIAEEVALSTLTIQISTTPLVAAGPSTGGFLGGLEAGWGSLVAVLGGLLVVLGALLPWAAVGGTAAVVTIAVVRLARRRRLGATPAEDAAAS